MSDAHDLRYGRYGNTETVFRLVGGEGAFSGVEMPEPVRSGARAKKLCKAEVLALMPGKVLGEGIFFDDPETDGEWVSLGPVRARQGEVNGDRAWFRLDVLGVDGYDGNGFNVGVSLSRDVHRRPEGFRMVAYQPTIRWPGGAIGPRVEYLNPEAGPRTIQNFDGSAGDLRLNRMYSDLRLRALGQNTRASATQVARNEVIVNTRPIANAGPDQFVTASDVQFDGSASRYRRPDYPVSLGVRGRAHRAGTASVPSYALTRDRACTRWH
ncbi:hypothetical protein ACS3QZ_01265 [Shimia sp. W99]